MYVELASTIVTNGGKRTLSENRQGIVDLDSHMVADCGELFLLRTNNIIGLRSLDLPSRTTLLGESTRDYDRFAVFLRFVRFFTLVF